MVCVLATNNPGKARELRALFAWEGGQSQFVTHSNQLKSLAELGLAFTPAEDGGTFEANATQKAVETMAFLREHAAGLLGEAAALFVLADDSGLVIDALGGAPGVDSALYLGVDTPFAVRNAHILEQMRDVPDAQRTARFVCVAACCLPDGSVVMRRGELEGMIAREAAGADGFGYDPIFYVPQMGRTLAQLTVDEKNIISHRGKAMQAMKEWLELKA
ncbi:MAG: non-canonical purine NTP pyrophosphatase [Defluviitaleaceae bacterium]|nr:non-canonical purine NTP pyrophosphatase [Defluviitaleaceae bacterium]